MRESTGRSAATRRSVAAVDGPAVPHRLPEASSLSSPRLLAPDPRPETRIADLTASVRHTRPKDRPVGEHLAVAAVTSRPAADALQFLPPSISQKRRRSSKLGGGNRLGQAPRVERTTRRSARRGVRDVGSKHPGEVRGTVRRAQVEPGVREVFLDVGVHFLEQIGLGVLERRPSPVELKLWEPRCSRRPARRRPRSRTRTGREEA